MPYKKSAVLKVRICHFYVFHEYLFDIIIIIT